MKASLRRAYGWALAAALVASGLLPGSAHATVPGRPGRIAYAARPPSGGEYDIYTRRLDGSHVKRLTRSHFSDDDPSWSASGKHIAWSCRGRQTGGDPYVATDLCVMKSDGSHKRHFEFATSAKSPIFSPDGESIAYIADGPDESATAPVNPYPNDDIWVIDRDGQNPRQITSNTIAEASISWSPDGTEIAFAGVNEDGDPGLYAVDVATGAERQITTDVFVSSSFYMTGSYYGSAIDWSPDGEHIVFVREIDDTTEVFVTDTTGAQQIRLTDDPEGDDNLVPTWSPNGSAILYRHGGPDSVGNSCIVKFSEDAGAAPTDHKKACRWGSQWDFSWQSLPD